MPVTCIKTEELMLHDDHDIASKNLAADTVLSVIQAINKEDFDEARTYLDDNMTFSGVLGSRDSGDAYIADMKHMKLKYTILKLFADGDDVCLLYDLEMGGKTIYCCGWYHVRDGRITMLRVVFDPRPFL